VTDDAQRLTRDAAAALGRGSPIEACELARRATESAPDDLRAAHTYVLALARSGATTRASAEYERLGLGTAGVTADPGLLVDLAALGARLAKDAALRLPDDDPGRRAALRDAARRYGRSASADPTGYCAVNAASLHLLADDRDQAAEWARRAVEDCHTVAVSDPLGAYWRAATLAEAQLVLGERADAVAELERAAGVTLPDLAPRFATRRQLQLLTAVDVAAADLLTHLPVPGVAAFSGHRLVEDAATEQELSDAMDGLLEQLGIGVGYGSLACGADILWAEGLVRRDAEVHIVLPCDVEPFLDASVRPGGEGWVRRFAAVLESSTTVDVVAPGGFVDDTRFRYAGDLAQGRAVLRAGWMAAPAHLLAVWDGDEPDGVAGTASDVARWRASGREAHTIAPVGARVRGAAPSTSADAGTVDWLISAALFGDFDGFGSLDDHQLPDFVDGTLTAIAAVLDRHQAHIRFRNSWGDGVYVVCPTAAHAAAIAIELQAAVDRRPVTEPQLRLGGHAGPMFSRFDPVQGRTTWWGRSVTTAARIEPRTPEGEVYVTEEFAALLALEPDAPAHAEYVGEVATAKGFGHLPLYVLRARPDATARSRAS
jgi:hypothetical protein